MPISLIHATVVLFVFLISLAISSEATALPPGLLISNMIAFMLGSSSAFFISFLISVDEVREVKRILNEIGFKEARLGVMVETPAAVQIIDDLCKEGIDFISFGTNDLTQYTLAIDRGNEAVQYLYNEMHPAVLSQLAYVISICKKYNIKTSICGQAGSNKNMVEFLVKHGIDSISVNADAAYDISIFVKDLEDRGLRGSEAGSLAESNAQEQNAEVKEEKIAEEKKEIDKKAIEKVPVDKLREREEKEMVKSADTQPKSLKKEGFIPTEKSGQIRKD